VKEIPVYRRGRLAGWAMVSDSDYPALVEHLWHLSPDGYVCRYTQDEGTVAMHRQILGLSHGDGLEGDHVNGDPLDNRRVNLRVATRAQNQQNRRSCGTRNGRSRYRGVSFCRQTSKWKATVVIDGQQHWIGRFHREEDAADAVAAFRRRHMPFAVDPTNDEEVALT
jgi:hypothetical protein